MRAATLAAAAPALGPRDGFAYGALAVPLAFVSLPLYVHLPYHYASVLGMPLATLGAVMLAVRLLDAVVDPALGRAVDGLFRQGLAWRAAAAGCGLLAVGFAALWQPPGASSGLLLPWLVVALLLGTLAYSAVSILHQSWGTRWGGGPGMRAQVMGWREAGTLLGVLLASALPSWLGWTATSAVLAVLLAAGLVALQRLPMPVGSAGAASAGAAQPWRHAPFRHLLAVFMLNGIANAIPATLLPFFVADRLQLPHWQAPLLLAYFGAAVVGLPLWVRAAGRWGLAPVWRAGMVASVLVFAATPALGAGDGAGFAAICVCSGLVLGADLALPGALLTGLVHRAGGGQRDEGRYIGWWTCATKLNLALAAGLALPLLSALGYRSGGTDPAGLQALAWAYGGLPCLLKLAAAAALWRAERLHPSWKERG